MSKSRPILFSAPMVQAILAGRKTQTRRVVKYPIKESRMHNILKPNSLPVSGVYLHMLKDGCELAVDINNGNGHCPYGVPGDTLWVRETWARHYNNFGTWKDKTVYRASFPEDRNAALSSSHDFGLFKWKPSIHMPRSASRITLTVKSVRVERLHDISENDARAEGVAWTSGGPLAPALFEALWKSINGADSWAANPWVWVVEFERRNP